jgi:hypothetical protein
MERPCGQSILDLIHCASRLARTSGDHHRGINVAPEVSAQPPPPTFAVEAPRHRHPRGRVVLYRDRSHSRDSLYSGRDGWVTCLMLTPAVSNTPHRRLVACCCPLLIPI